MHDTPRRLPIGAEPFSDGVSFRVWAPTARQVDVHLSGGIGAEEHPLAAEGNGYFSCFLSRAKPGDLYRFRLDGAEVSTPDPASRFQPDGPLGPSRIVDPSSFLWSDAPWPGLDLERQIIYEMHVGTFTPAGTYSAAMERLPYLAELGITTVELMPVADFVGDFGWGYDGVNYFAPTRLYGEPDDLRRFVDRAHGLGLGVVLDVVYNHAGPAGNCLKSYSPSYFTRKYSNDWGESFNFDGPDCAPVREFFLANARHWIEEYHFDGFRLDATQAIQDASPEHILTAIAREARGSAGDRKIVLIAENEPQEMNLLRGQESGGQGLDAIWNDDFHRTAMVAATGRREGYYRDHLGSAQEFVSLARHGTTYQGQRSLRLRKPRGCSTRGIPASAFITYLQNHDQVATSLRGERGHLIASPARWRALTAYWLLAPGTPMFFQGQEFQASSPFLFFADHHAELAKHVRRGRGQFLAQFRSLSHPEVQRLFPHPDDPAVFESCKLLWEDCLSHAAALAFHRDLIRLRKTEIHSCGASGLAMEGAALSFQTALLRYARPDGRDLLLVMNLGPDWFTDVMPEPLWAPPVGCDWRLRWTSEDPAYGGHGSPPVETVKGWHFSAETTMLLAADPV